jgi:hypothetical protein
VIKVWDIEENEQGLWPTRLMHILKNAYLTDGVHSKLSETSGFRTAGWKCVYKNPFYFYKINNSKLKLKYF